MPDWVRSWPRAPAGAGQEGEVGDGEEEAAVRRLLPMRIAFDARVTKEALQELQQAGEQRSSRGEGEGDGGGAGTMVP